MQHTLWYFVACRSNSQWVLAAMLTFFLSNRCEWNIDRESGIQTRINVYWWESVVILSVLCCHLESTVSGKGARVIVERGGFDMSYVVLTLLGRKYCLCSTSSESMPPYQKSKGNAQQQDSYISCCARVRYLREWHLGYTPDGIP